MASLPRILALPFGGRLVSAFLVALLLVVAAPIPALALRPNKSSKGDLRAIEQIEQQIRTSLLTGNVSSLDHVLADDFLGISANGTLSDKQQYLRRVSKREHLFSQITVTEQKIRLQATTAIVTSLADVVGNLDGTNIHGTYRYTRVYSRQATGNWQVINFEATRVSGTANDDMRRGVPMHR